MQFYNLYPYLIWGRKILLSIVVTLLFATCSGDSDPTGTGGTTGSISSIELTSTSTELTAFGETVVLTAKAVDANGNEISGANFQWETSDPAVVTLSAENQLPGRANVTAVNNGDVSITVQASGITADISVTVNQQVADILPELSLVLEFPGDTAFFDVVAVDARGNIMPDVAINWRSRTTTVAAIDNDGVAIAQGFGRAILEATAESITKDMILEVIGNEFFMNGDIRLRYDLKLPDANGGPFPAMVFVHGSGRLTRGNMAHAANPFVSRGIAMLTYDKRGVGESTGEYNSVGVANGGTTLGRLADDAIAAVRFLKKFPQIDPQRIGLIGNSQGGWISPLAATRSDEIAFMLLWSGPTVSVGLEIFYSNLADGTPTPLDSVYAQLPGFTGPHGYEPFSTLVNIDIPSLWLYGGMDRSIPVRVDTLNMRRLQELGKPYDYILYPYGRHDLRDVRNGQFVSLWDDYAAWLREKGFL